MYTVDKKCRFSSEILSRWDILYTKMRLASESSRVFPVSLQVTHATYFLCRNWPIIILLPNLLHSVRVYIDL